jgi:hypothetical protein
MPPHLASGERNVLEFKENSMQRSRVSRISTCMLILLHMFIAAAAALSAPGASAQSTTPQYLYVPGAVSNGQGSNVLGITTYTVNQTTGALTQIAAPPVQVRGGLGALAVNNTQTFLFAAGLNSASQGSVEVFNTSSDGSLTEVANSPFGISNPQASPQAVAVSPNGSYIYVASTVPSNNSGENQGPESTIVDVFAIGSDGSLTLTTTFPFSAVVACGENTIPTTLTPVQFYIHPTRKFLYLFMQSSYGPPCSGQPSEVQPFTINSDGTLTPGAVDILPLYATDGYALVGTPDGSVMFLMTKLNTNYGFIYQSQVDSSTGDIGFGLVYSATDFDQPVMSPGGLAVDSTSSYLYSSAGSFQIQDGTLTAIDDSTNPFTSGGSLLASPTLPLLFGVVLSAPENQVGPFYSEQVDGDGSLTPAPGSPYNFTSPGILSGTTPIPTKAVMWVTPHTPIDISGVVVGQTGTGGAAVQNVGYGTLTISSVTLTGDSSLTVINNCTSPVAPGGTCGVGATFAPTSVGTFTGTLTIVSSIGTRTLSISATSIAPYSQPILNAPSPILFPDTSTGSSSPLTYTLSNLSTATASFTVSSVTIAGSNPGDFSQTNTCTAASPLAPGASCSITVTFTPQALGTRAATLNINGPTGAEVQSSLTGTGVTTVTKYALTTSVTGPGTITQSPTGTSLANNTTITLTATPNASSSFVDWGGVCPNTVQLVCSFVLNSNTTATANFAANVTFNLIVVGSGTVTQSPQGTSFAPETTITLNAFPNTGAQFVSWLPTSACNIPANAPTVCYALLTTNTTITATFTSPNQYTLSTNTNGSGLGTITQSPAGTSFAPNTPITLTAVPTAGNAFGSWYLGPCNGSTNPVCAFNISSNVATTAQFGPAYTISTTVVGPGTITQSPTGTTLVAGTGMTLTAVPSAGATFTSWSGGACAGSTSTSCVFNLVQNTTVTATFAAAAQYTLTTTASGPGMIQQSPPGITFSSGTTITLTAVPNTGASFTNWSGACASSTSTTCTFNITANTSVTGTFAGAPAVTVPDPSQSGSAGSAFTFALSTSGFSTPPTLKASCAIPEGTCTISGTTLTVTTTATPARATHDAVSLIAVWPGDSAHGGSGGGSVLARRTIRAMLVAMLALLFAAFAVRVGATSRRRMRLAFAPLAISAMVAGLALLAACGGGGGGGGGQIGTPAGTYTVTVTATAGTQTATTNVSVTLQ